MTREQLRQQGEATRASLFGATTHGPAGLGTLLTEAVHCAVGNRPGLARPDRMLCTLAALAVWPRLRQLRRHIVAALELGVSPESIREVFVQTAPYSGFPPALNVLNALSDVLR